MDIYLVNCASIAAEIGRKRPDWEFEIYSLPSFDSVADDQVVCDLTIIREHYSTAILVTLEMWAAGDSALADLLIEASEAKELDEFGGCDATPIG